MSADTAGSLEARLNRLEDLEAIRQLLLDYGARIDGRQFERCSQLFTGDGIYDVGFTSAVGPAAALEVMNSMIGPLMASTPGADFHVFANPVIELDGDQATVRSFWAFVTPDDRSNPQIAHFGHYEDLVVRHDGEWKFARRTAVRDIGVPPSGY
jgi:hypothetical protein